MSREELRHEISTGVRFWGYEEEGALAAVMGLQDVLDVTLIRHAYVRTERQKQGIGAEMLTYLRAMAHGPVLIGTWSDALWAIRFYEHHGFRIVGAEEKERLLRKYWSVSERQIQASVVLADEQWRNRGLM